MLVLLLCCMMKIVEFSTGKPVVNQGRQGKYRRHMQCRRKGKNTVITTNKKINKVLKQQRGILSNYKVMEYFLLVKGCYYKMMLSFYSTARICAKSF